MQDALIITTTIAVLLFVGVICSWVGNRLKIPDALLLLIAGMLLAQLTYHGETVIQFPTLFLNALAIFALAMISFNSTTQIRWREFDTLSARALKLTLNTVFLMLTLFAAISHYLIGLSVYSSLVLAAIMIGSEPDVTLGLVKKSRAGAILQLESIFSIPFTVILPFLLMSLMQNVPAMAVDQLLEQLVPFLLDIIVGLGAGIFVGIVLFKVVQKAYTEVYSPLAVIIAALLAYVLAENLGGAGVLATSILGLFLGNVYVKEKIKLLSSEHVLTKAFYILVFVLTGVIIKLPLTTEFFVTSTLLFAAYLFTRFLVTITMGKEYNIHEKLFMSLNVPKGTATVAVVFVLALYNIPEISTVINMTFAFILYSIILSAITAEVTRYHENRPHRY